MKLSVAIMAHPDRKDLVYELWDTLGSLVPASWDEQGPPSGNSDRVWANARAAWLMHDPAADWHLLLQDDAVPCPHLLPGLERALDHLPGDAAVSLYLGSGRNVSGRWARMAARADQQGAAWIRSHRLVWGVAIALPTRLIPDMIAWCDRKAGVPDDMRVGGWAGRRQLDTWYTWPSLVDHRAVPSLTKHRAVDRVAARHHQGSALEIDWSGPVVLDPMIARRRGPRSAPTGTRG